MTGAIGGSGGRAAIGPTAPGPGGDGLQALKDGRVEGDAQRLRTATQLLEGTFYQEVFKAMRATVPEGGMVSGGSGEEIFTGMLDQTVADAAAARNDGGLGSALYRYLTQRIHGGASPTPGPHGEGAP